MPYSESALKVAIVGFGTVGSAVAAFCVTE